MTTSSIPGHNDVGRRPRTSLEQIIEFLPPLLENIDRLVARMEIEHEQSSSAIAAFRGKSNQMVFNGMAIPDANGRWSQDFTVPFASVAVADMNSIGDLTVTTDAMGGSSGPGTVIIKKGRFACFPLEGRHLSITAGTPPGTLFVAVYIDLQPIVFGSAT